MFLNLHRHDGQPVLVNASQIVTIHAAYEPGQAEAGTLLTFTALSNGAGELHVRETVTQIMSLLTH